jgi:hypothetical protein
MEGGKPNKQEKKPQPSPLELMENRKEGNT